MVTFGSPLASIVLLNPAAIFASLYLGCTQPNPAALIRPGHRGRVGTTNRGRSGNRHGPGSVEYHQTQLAVHNRTTEKKKPGGQNGDDAPNVSRRRASSGTLARLLY